MAISISAGLTKRLAGRQGARRKATSLSLLDSGASYDRVLDANSLMSASAFAVGFMAKLFGATSASNDKECPIVAVAPGYIQFPSGTLVANQSSGSSTLGVFTLHGGSWADILYNAQLDIYSGTRPTNADATEGSGTLLVSFTKLKFGNATWDATNARSEVDLLIAPATAVALATGTASWGRLRGGGVYTTGADSTLLLCRVDGTCGVGTGDIQLSSLSITAAATETLNSFKIYLPQAA